MRACHEALESICPLDDRDKLEFRDRIKDIQRRSQTVQMAPTAEAMVVVANPENDPGVGSPTPECSLEFRGDETSIAEVASELHVRLGERAGSVGKRLKNLYADRYGQAAAAVIPKRRTQFRGF